MSGLREPELREPDLPRTAKVRPKALRTGWTTRHAVRPRPPRTAATALRDQCRPGEGRGRAAGRPPGQLRRRVLRCRRPVVPTAVVVKDAGDDPDVTHGAHLTATGQLARRAGSSAWKAATGVGVVTKPGLGIPVGEPGDHLRAARDDPCRRSARCSTPAGAGSRWSSRSRTASGWPARRPTPGWASSAASRSWARPGSSGRSRPRPGGPASCRRWR